MSIGAERRAFNDSEVERKFIEALAQRNLNVGGRLIADGEIQRCDAANKKGNSGRGDGSYVLYLDSWPAGSICNWTDGRGWESWSYNDPSGRKMTAEESAELERRMQEQRAVTEAKRKQRYAEGAAEAERLWSSATSGSGQPI